MNDDEISKRRHDIPIRKPEMVESSSDGTRQDDVDIGFWRKRSQELCSAVEWLTGEQRRLNNDVIRLRNEKSSLIQENSRQDRLIAELTQELDCLQTRYSETDRRLGVMLAAGSMSDRGSLSISGSDSQPDRISHEFVAFRARVEEIVRGAKRHAQLADLDAKKQFGPQYTAALSLMLFAFGSSKLGLSPSAPEFISPADVWSRFRTTAGITEVEEVRLEVSHACTQAVALVRRVVLATAPHEPGQVVFLAPGSAVDSNLEVFPGCVDGSDAVVSQTVFPGYRVGDSVWVKPMVWTRVV